MKRLLFAAATFAALVACTKTADVYEEAGQIGLAPVNYLTKVDGAISGTAYPENESFNVFAVYTASDAGTLFQDAAKPLTAYLTNAQFVNKGEKWGGNTPYYWPKTGSLYFAGYSPNRAVCQSASYNFEGTPGLVLTGFTQGEYGKAGNQPSNTMVDLMWFDHTQTSANSGAPAVTFKHALSYLTMTFKSTEEHKGIFTLKKVTLNGVKMTGDFTSNDKKWATTAAQTESLKIYDGTQLLDATAFTADHLLLIPQEIVPSSLEIQYEQKTPAGELITNTQTFTLKGGDTSGETIKQWLIGYHYTYNFKFSFSANEEILLTPSVEAWSEAKAQDFVVE